MSCFAFSTRVLLPVMCLAGVFLAAGGARAQQSGDARCSRSPESCDFQEDRTVLRPELWSGDCQPSRWDSLSPRYFPVEERDGKRVLQVGPRAPVNFLNGVCEVHKKEGGNIDVGISELQKAQTQGLMASQRNLAALFEGELHCRALSALQKKYGSALTEQTAPRELFCLHRGMAKASFTQVNWTNLELRYAGGPFSLDTHADEMAQCYADYLHAGFDATCGIIASPSGDTIQKAAEDSANEVLTSYFGNATGEPTSENQGVSPLKAMLARKLKMADASLQSSTALLDGIHKKNALLNDSYEGLSSLYCTGTAEGVPCAGPLPSRVSRLEAAYQRAVLKARNILGFLDQWFNGLFEVGGKDVRKELRTNTQELSKTLTGVETSRPGQPSLLDDLRTVKHDMEVLADGGASERKNVLSMCGVYFCELRNRNKDLFRRACEQFDLRTGKKLSESNKLCAPEAEKTFLSDDQRASALGVCQAAGFPDSLMTKPQMTASEVDACMTQFHPE
jgi:hypothetical protein